MSVRAVAFAAAVMLAAGCIPVPVGPPPPGDAGTVDAGFDDGGASDGGLGDGGLSDAGSSDAGFGASPWEWIAIPGSKCAGGSTAGLGLNRSDAGADLFLFVQGGGACWNTGTCRPSPVQYGPLCDYGNFCLLDATGGQQPTAVHVTEGDPYPADAGGAIPSELAVLNGSRVTRRSLADNPFRQANFVYVPYCTGDLHSGNVVRNFPFKADAFAQQVSLPTRFVGAANMDLYLAYLKTVFPNVQRIWLVGVSGGAYGATLNFERVQKAFPLAEVALLSDSGPLIHAAAHWPEWRDQWAMQLPDNCPSCDAGFPQIIEHLTTTYSNRRIGLLSYDADKVISWFLLAGPGLQNFLTPPTGAFGAALTQLENSYDPHANSKYFVAAGDQHVLLAGYGALLSDGGYSDPLPSRDGGTNLRAWINAWAVGDGGWQSTR